MLVKIIHVGVALNQAPCPDLFFLCTTVSKPNKSGMTKNYLQKLVQRTVAFIVSIIDTMFSVLSALFIWGLGHILAA